MFGDAEWLYFHFCFQTKSKSKTPSGSPAKALTSRSPAKSLTGGTSPKMLSSGSPAKAFTSASNAKTLTSSSPAKALSSRSPTKTLTSGTAAKLWTSQSKCLATGCSIKILTSGNEPKLLTYVSSLKQLAQRSPGKLVTSKTKWVSPTVVDKPQDASSGDSADCLLSETTATYTFNSRNYENIGSINESPSATSTCPTSPLPELSNESSCSEANAKEIKETVKSKHLLNLKNCAKAKVLVEDICKKRSGKPSMLPTAGKRPRGRPRKELTMDCKKPKGPSDQPSWLLAGKNKPGRKPKSRITDALHQSKHAPMITSLKDNYNVMIKTEIKEELPDDSSISTATVLNNNAVKEARDTLEGDWILDGVELPPGAVSVQIKKEPVEDLKPDISEELPGLIKHKDSPGDIFGGQSDLISYPSEQGHFLNIFGLIKKSDIKQESLKNKLHREVGGKLRRVIKPRMAPEMVYNKLTLARGCTLVGESEDKSVLTKDTVRSAQKARPLHADSLKPKTKMHEAKQTTPIKLTSQQLTLAQSLFNSGKLAAAKRLLCEGKMPNSELFSKKLLLKPPPKTNEMHSGANGTMATSNEHTEKTMKKEKLLGRLTTPTASSNKIQGRKQPLTKMSNSAVSLVKEESAGTRRSSRHQGSKRKQWWHLLRAAPDEFEEDKAWDEEQVRLEKRRKMLKEKRKRELFDHLQVKEHEAKDLSSSQESSSSESKPAKHQCTDVDLMESKKLKRSEQSASGHDEDFQSEIESESKVASSIVLSESCSDQYAPTNDVKDWMEVDAESNANLKRKRKKKKKKFGDEEPSAQLPHHSDLVQQIQPLVKNLMEGGAETESMQLEMELKSEQLETCVAKNSADAPKVSEEAPTWPEAAICEGYQCTIPHMCSTCWINDHMYCLNMKRIARDLPPFGGCLHYSLCSHYPRRDIEHKPAYKCTKFVPSEPSVEPLCVSATGGTLAVNALQPITESDLFCNEQMVESDESSPGSPVPQGTEILKAQLKARAVQIAKSLGMPSSEAHAMRNQHVLKEVAYVSLNADQDDSSDADTLDNSSIAINQHGAELVLYNGQSYMPNHTFEDSDEMPAGWLKPISAPKQSPASGRSPKSTQDVDHKAKKLQIRLCPPENLDMPLNDISKVGVTHKLVRVKVHRVGDNKILLKQMKDLGSLGSEEVLIREIELPATSDSKNEEMDINWLSNILAEEAVKLASVTDKIIENVDQLKGKKKHRKSELDIPASPSPITFTETDSRQSPSLTDNASDSVPWTIETIEEDGDEGNESNPEEIPIYLDRDITEKEVDPKMAALITITAAAGCKMPDLPIWITSMEKTSTDTQDSILNISTKEIREEDQDVLHSIKVMIWALYLLCYSVCVCVCVRTRLFISGYL